jgi:hypothetical protein
MSMLYLISGSLGGLPLVIGPAKYAFQSRMTKQVIRYVEAMPGTWAFLTYHSGLVLPEQYLSEHPAHMRRLSLEEFHEWSTKSYEGVHYHLTSLPKLTGVTFLCSHRYHADMAAWIVRDFGVPVLCPLDHLTDQQRSLWLTNEIQRNVPWIAKTRSV